MSDIIELYQLLPRVYREVDDGTLKSFLGGFQAVLENIHTDEELLRLIQDIGQTRKEYLKYIARSLGWQLRATDEEEQRAEVRRVADYYDLKGTPYAIRFLARFYLDDVFSRLVEFYEGDSSSASSIIEDYESADQMLKKLLAGEGHIISGDWAAKQQATRGRVYGFDPQKRAYSYFIRCDVTESNYTPLYSRVKQLLADIQTMHPAGRFGYLYFIAEGMENDDIQLGADLLDDLVGGARLDELWKLDTGKRLDTPTHPVSPSESWWFDKLPNTLGESKRLDTGWHLDDTHAAVGVLVEIS